MVKAFNGRKMKDQILKIFKHKLLQMSILIFRKYFVEKVVARIKNIFMDAALKGYRKIDIIKKRKNVLMSIKAKDGVPNFIKRIFNARIHANHTNQQDVMRQVMHRRSKGFIGKLKKLHVYKKKVLPKRKVRMETLSALPILSKSSTIVSPTENSMKVIRGRFSELSLKNRLEKKLEIDKIKKHNRENPIKEKAKSPMPERHSIHALDSGFANSFK